MEENDKQNDEHTKGSHVIAERDDKCILDYLQERL
jgi:hypothetical protein